MSFDHVLLSSRSSHESHHCLFTWFCMSDSECGNGLILVAGDGIECLTLNHNKVEMLPSSSHRCCIHFCHHQVPDGYDSHMLCMLLTNPAELILHSDLLSPPLTFFLPYDINKAVLCCAVLHPSIARSTIWLRFYLIDRYHCGACWFDKSTTTIESLRRPRYQPLWRT